MNKEQAVEIMATFVQESIAERPRNKTLRAYTETCSDLYDVMKEQGIIA
jgi:hypothetical protein